MARRRDRGLAELTTGARKFDRANGTLPRSINRDFEAFNVRTPIDAVYPSAERAPQRRRQFQSRVWDPGGRVLAVPSRVARTVGTGSFYAKPVFSVPHRVKICLRRKARREVLFAVRKAGFRGSAPKRHYRRSANSFYGC